MNKIIFFILVQFLLISFSYSDDSVLPDFLVFLPVRYPAHFGVRQSGMGFTGFSYPYDENVVLLNPAGLGIENDRYRRVSFMYSILPKTMNFYEYDEFKFFEQHFAVCSQPSLKNVGGFGFAFNMPVWHVDYYIPVTVWDPDSGIINTGKYLEDEKICTKFTLAYAHDLPFIPFGKHALGFGCKYAYFHDKIFNGKITNNVLSIDLGYNGVFNNRIFMGFVVSNLKIYNEDEEIGFIEIPRIVYSLGVNELFDKSSDNKLSIFIETNYVHCFKYDFSEWNLWRNNILNFGCEARLLYFLFIRTGISYSFDTNDKIVPFGFGMNLFNRYELNFFHTAYATKDFDRKRFGFSLSIMNLFE